MGEEIGGKGGEKWGKGGGKWREKGEGSGGKGREVGNAYPPVHPLLPAIRIADLAQM